MVNKEKRVISYHSRKLKDHEKRYSTSEKELLGIYQAVESFKPYLIGMKFTILTDHKPLIGTLKNKTTTMLGRWGRRLLSIDEMVYDIEYIEGSRNQAADHLSRRINVIRVEVLDLKTLQENDNEIVNMKDDDTMAKTQGILMKRMKNRIQCIVLPKILRKQAMREAHGVGHFNTKKSVARLKENFYWPNMGKDVNEFVLHANYVFV